jgi:hypothetical protein
MGPFADSAGEAIVKIESAIIDTRNARMNRIDPLWHPPPCANPTSNWRKAQNCVHMNWRCGDHPRWVNPGRRMENDNDGNPEDVA